MFKWKDQCMVSKINMKYEDNVPNKLGFQRLNSDVNCQDYNCSVYDGRNNTAIMFYEHLIE